MNSAFVEITPWQLLVMGGPIMVPILLCSFFALTIIVQKIHYFRFLSSDDSSLKELIFSHVHQNRIKEAILACEASHLWVAPVFKAGLVKFGGSRQDIVDAMEDAARFEIPKLERGLTILSTIASVTPLAGLLGTVVGLCGSFHTIQVRAAAMNPVTPGDIAGGIWQALITTAVSLLISIPSFIFYNYFVNKVHVIVRDMEKAAMRLADLMTRASEFDIPGKE